ncbi:MAG: H-X9-DG-CTERM domain-containing protein [Bacillota bacterium]
MVEYCRGQGGGAVDAERVIAVEPLLNHENEGMNVLFGDGHVEWLTREAAEALLVKEGIGGGNRKPQMNADERR